jgi:hypothetical protein
MSDSINYGTHAAADQAAPAGAIDYGAHTQPSLGDRALDAAGDVAAGAWSKMNPANMVSGALETLKAIREKPLDVAKEIFLHPYMAVGRGIDAMKAGKPEEAAAHFNSAFDPPGSGIEESRVKLATPGQRATGLGELLGTGAVALAGGKAPDAVPAVTSAAKTAADLATTPGAGAMIGGAGEALVGAGQLPHSLPVGAGIIMRGAGDAYKGFVKFKAARAAAAAEADAAAASPVPMTGPNPLAPVASASTLDPAAIAPVQGPENAAQYATGTLPVPAPAAAPAPVIPEPVIPPAVVEQPVAAAPGAPEGANAKLSPQEAEWLKKRSADTAAKDDVVAQFASDRGMTKIESGQPYADLIKSVNQANKDAGIPKKYKLPDITNDAHLKRVDAVNALLDSKNAAAATAKTAADLAAQGVTSAMPEKFGVTSPADVLAMRGELMKIEAAKAAGVTPINQAAPSLADQLQASIDQARAKKP